MRIPPLAHPPSARPSEKPLSNKSGGNQHLFFSFFTKTRIAKSADARKVQERHAEEILTIGRTELRFLRNVVIRLQQTTKFSINDIASQICSGRARPGDAMDSKLSIQDQMSSRDVEKSQEKSYVQKNTQDPLKLFLFSGIYEGLRRAELES